MKNPFVILIVLFALFCAPFIYDSMGNSRCEIKYDTSFNGLWIIKQRVCYGQFIGLVNSRTEITRKALFTKF